MSEQYNLLQQKLKKFIRKYYKNQLIRGSIYCLAIFLAFFLFTSLAEYFGRFNSTVRTILFYSSIILLLFVLVKFLVVPLLKLFRIGKTIQYETAATIIGKHFPEVKDKLLNALQLRRVLSDSDSQLLQASIDQKISEIKPVPFQDAVSFSVNRKYVKYPLILVLILVGILLFSPDVITESSNRLVKHQIEFAKDQPFDVSIVNDSLSVLQYENYKLEVEVAGKELPDMLFIRVEGNNYLMRKGKQKNHFSYEFINLQQNVSFYFYHPEYQSPQYTLEVLPRPLINNFTVEAVFPAYTQMKPKTWEGVGDLTIPEGSVVNWTFTTQNTELVNIVMGDQTYPMEKVSPFAFKFSRKVFKNTNYSVISSNKYVKVADSMEYSLQVVPDGYPSVIVEEIEDSLMNFRKYFSGIISDDYGFSNLEFHVGSNDNFEKEKLSIDPSIQKQKFYHSIDFSRFDGLQTEIEYYFIVWDNDAVNGFKSVKSQVFKFTPKTEEEIKQENDKTLSEIKDEATKSLQELRELKQDIEKVRKELKQKDQVGWQEQEKLRELKKRGEELQQSFEEIVENFEKSERNQQELDSQDQQLLEKQKQVQELFEELIKNEEFKKMIEDLEEVLKELEKERMDEALEEMELSNEEMEEMLDRNLELFKQLEFEQKLNEKIKEFNELAEKQKELATETKEEKKSNADSIQKEQQEISEKFEELKEELEELEELNQELEDPNEFEVDEQLEEQIEEEMDKASESLQDQKMKEASESQNNAGEKMQEMAQSLFEMQQSMIQESMGEDMETLRTIMENLLQLSFDQENLIEKVKATNPNDPLYQRNIKEQNNLKNDMVVVKDSLQALSKRQIMIEPFISGEIKDIDSNMDKAIANLNNQRSESAASNQQFAMMGMNNLALMLSETMQQMMSAMSMPASGSCKNPGIPKAGQGQSKQSIKSMRQLQQQLNQQLQQMQEGIQNKGMKGKPQQNGGKESEQLSRAAAEQEYLRNELRKISDEMEKSGQFGQSKLLKELMSEMEKTESDIVNKMISKETMQRQKDIITRLLESEKAEMEREKDEKRKSEEAKSEKYRNPEELIKYKQLRSNDEELLRTVPNSFKPFYKRKINSYFFKLEELFEQ